MTFLRNARSGSVSVALLLTGCVAIPTAGFAQQPVAPPSYDKIPAAKTPSQAGTADQKTSDSAGKTPETSAKSGGETKSDNEAKSDNDARNANDGGKAKDSVKDQRASNRAAFFDARLAALHAGLTLNADQESLWSPVESAIRDLEKTRGRRRSRQEIASLLDESPSDLLRMRSEQLLQRGKAIKSLVDATGPLLDKLDDAQKGRLPLLLRGMQPAFILRAAFDIRYGRVVDDPDDDSSSKMKDRPGMSDDGDQDQGMGRHRDHDSRAERGDDRPGAQFDDGRGDPMPRHGESDDRGDAGDRT